MTHASPQDTTKTTLHHAPVISEDGNFFESHEEHSLEQEKKRKQKAMAGLGAGVAALCLVGVIGFMSNAQVDQKIFSASIISIPSTVESAGSLEICKHEAEKVSTTEAERKEREQFCEEKFSMQSPRISQ